MATHWRRIIPGVRSTSPLGFLAICLITIVPATDAHAQQERTIPFRGREIVCHILFSLGLTPIESTQEAAADPEGSMIIVLGDPSVLGDLHKATGSLKAYLKAGGSLLIATDHAYVDGNLGFGVSGSVVRAPEDALGVFAYHRIAECPKLTYTKPGPFRIDPNAPDGQFVRDPEGVRTHPIFAFLHKGIATNYPSYIQTVLDFDDLAPTPDELLLFPFRIREARRAPAYMVGSPKDAPPSGRALYIAGHGMFMNGMMLQPDNDNFQFTVNAFKWLQQRPQGTPRTKALLIVNGEIVTDFDMKLTPPLPPVPIPPSKVIARLIRGLEDERWFHHTVNDAIGSNIGRVCAIIAGIATLVLIIYGAKKFAAGRHHLETRVPIVAGPQPIMSAAAPMEQRQQAMLQQGDLWEEARFLALRWFRQELDVTPNKWHDGVDARFEAAGIFWSRWRLERHADYVLRLASDPARVNVSRHDFFILVEALRDLSAALRDGRLALLVEGKNVKQA